MMQDCKEANEGYGVAPTVDCAICGGHGFYYEDNWARTCKCKKHDN